jgi:hypothetical protein
MLVVSGCYQNYQNRNQMTDVGKGEERVNLVMCDRGIDASFI